MTTRVRRTIAVIEIVGGALGVFTSTLFVVQSGLRGTLVALIVCVMLAVFGLHILAGTMLWFRPDRGLKLSIAAQLLVLPRVISPVASLYFVSGLNATVGFEYWWDATSPMFPPGAHGSGIWTDWLVGSFVQFRFMSGGPPRIAIGVNLAAVVLLVLLMRARRTTPTTEVIQREGTLAPFV